MACTVERLRQAARNVPVVLLLGRLKNEVLRWVRSRNVCRPRTGGDRRDRWRMLMKRLLLYTTTGCGGSRRLAAANPPSYRIISLLEY